MSEQEYDLLAIALGLLFGVPLGLIMVGAI